VIGRQLKQLTRLVDDLLDLSRITRGKIELKMETLDAADSRPRGGRDLPSAGRRAAPRARR
jgi:signal transduction histidine kinase